MRIKEATQSQERNDASVLFAEYYTSVGFDSPSCVSRLLCDIERSDGRIFLAYTGEVAMAVASYVYTEPSVAELRGLYVRPSFRSKGWGAALLEAVVVRVHQQEGLAIRLYTLPTLKEAISLYHKNGFVQIPPYKEGLLENTVFMEKIL